MDTFQYKQLSRQEQGRNVFCCLLTLYNEYTWWRLPGRSSGAIGYLGWHEPVAQRAFAKKRFWFFLGNAKRTQQNKTEKPKQ